MMTKEQYLEWVKTRGEPGTWDIEACCEADALIRHTALENLKSRLQKEVKYPNNTPQVIVDFVMDMATSLFGSVEVDNLCLRLECYPDWILESVKDNR